MTQYFKGDALERKFYGSADKVFLSLKATLIKWFEEAYEDQKFGGILYDNNTTPLTGVIPRDVFIKNFNRIFEMWRYAGNFESYLYVFKNIFGGGSQITFEKAAPAYLKIKISADNTTLFNWIVAQVVENEEHEEVLEEDELITSESAENIVFQEQLGITDFRELQGVLNSLNPAGIFLEVDFSIISEGV